MVQQTWTIFFLLCKKRRNILPLNNDKLDDWNHKHWKWTLPTPWKWFFSQNQWSGGALRNFSEFAANAARFLECVRPLSCNFSKKVSLAQVFPCEFCKISKNAFFLENASDIHNTSNSNQIKLDRSFLPYAPFLYPLKTKKPYGFLMFSGGREMVFWEQMF